MNATRSLLAGAALATVAFGAFAADTAYASDEGLPPNIAASQSAERHAAANAVVQSGQSNPVPQYLIVPAGEITLVPNPAFQAQPKVRDSALVIRTQSVPAVRYVGA